MSRKRRMKQKRDSTPTQAVNSVAVWLNDNETCVSGYTSLDQNPEIMTACRRIAQLIGAISYVPDEAIFLTSSSDGLNSMLCLLSGIKKVPDRNVSVKDE